jgi:hypothetical protein
MAEVGGISRRRDVADSACPRSLDIVVLGEAHYPSTGPRNERTARRPGRGAADIRLRILLRTTSIPRIIDWTQIARRRDSLPACGEGWGGVDSALDPHTSGCGAGVPARELPESSVTPPPPVSGGEARNEPGWVSDSLPFREGLGVGMGTRDLPESIKNVIFFIRTVTKSEIISV